MLGHLHRLVSADDQPGYWRLQVLSQGGHETLLLTESELSRAQERSSRHFESLSLDAERRVFAEMNAVRAATGRPSIAASQAAWVGMLYLMRGSEDAFAYARVLVQTGDVVRPLLFTEHELERVRERSSRHPALHLPAPAEPAREAPIQEIHPDPPSAFATEITCVPMRTTFWSMVLGMIRALFRFFGVKIA